MSTSPTTTVLIRHVGDGVRIDSLDELVRMSSFVARATVEEQLPGVPIGYGASRWVGTPTRFRITDLLYDDTAGAVGHEPVVLQTGGLFEGELHQHEGQTVFEPGTDALVFATHHGGQADDPSEYWIFIEIEIDDDGTLVENGWTGTAPFLVGTSFDEVAAAIAKL